jgi:hypothetical protein
MSDAVHSIDAYTQRLDLQESIGWLIPHLPRQSLISVRGEADYYGAASEIARALGLKTTPLAAASWVHGWALVRPDNAVAITGSQPGNRVHLVDRTSTEDTLLRAGYPNAFAVGLPILYSKVPDLPRRKRSLLLAPFHSLPEITPHNEQKRNEQEFCEYAVAQRDKYDCICASLHSSCVASRQWIDTLEAHGIPWVLGARTDDENALRRVRTLFASFDCILTNEVTSVAVYGAFFGARISVSGPAALLPPVESFAKHPHYQRHPELLKNLELRHPDRLKSLFPFLFAPPDEATCPHEWASIEVGEKHVMADAEIARLLGWRYVDGDPVWAGVDRRNGLATFGWLPPQIGSQDVLEKVAQVLAPELKSEVDVVNHLKVQRDAVKTLGKEVRAAKVASTELATIKKSWAWRLLAKPLFSIEKRLRGLR